MSTPAFRGYKVTLLYPYADTNWNLLQNKKEAGRAKASALFRFYKSSI